MQFAAMSNFCVNIHISTSMSPLPRHTYIYIMPDNINILIILQVLHITHMQTSEQNKKVHNINNTHINFLSPKLYSCFT